MIKKLPLNGLKWSDPNKYTCEFVKHYDGEKSNKSYLLELNIKCPKHLHKAHRVTIFS